MPVEVLPVEVLPVGVLFVEAFPVEVLLLEPLLELTSDHQRCVFRESLGKHGPVSFRRKWKLRMGSFTFPPQTTRSVAYSGITEQTL